MLFSMEQLQTIERIAEIAVKSGHFQYAAGRENGQTIYNNLTVEQAISIIMTGVELGVGPMTALRNITPYRQGKPPIMSAHLETSLAQAHGYQIVEISKSDKHVELAIERGAQRLGTYRLTVEQVTIENNGKLSNNWRTNTLDMLLKTAKVRLVRTYASQALGGAMYISEEMPQHVSDDTYVPDDDIAEDTEPTPPNVTDIAPPVEIEDGAGDDEDLFQASGVGNISYHMRGQLFQLGSEWAAMLHPEDPKFESHRKAWAKSHLPALNSFTQLNNAGALFLRRMLNVDIITALAFEVYPGEDKETELADWVSPGAETFDSLSMTALENLKASLKKKLGEKLDKAS